MKFSALLSILVLLLLFSACSQAPRTEDIQAELAILRNQSPERIDPLPSLPHHLRVYYTQAQGRDPFQGHREWPTPDQVLIPQLQPDTERLREPLENWPLEQLRLAGIIEHQNKIRALILSPEERLYAVQPGQYLGQQDGRITAITPQGLTLTELILDGQGQWQERQQQLYIAK